MTPFLSKVTGNFDGIRLQSGLIQQRYQWHAGEARVAARQPLEARYLWDVFIPTCVIARSLRPSHSIEVCG